MRSPSRKKLDAGGYSGDGLGACASRGSGTRAEFEAELRRRKIDPAALKVVLELAVE